MNPSRHGFTPWLDRFFESYFARRPVNATFVGEHAYDHVLPDLSENGMGDTLAGMRGLLEDLGRLPAESLTPAMEVDRKLARGVLRIEDWEYRSSHFQRGNPALYTGEAVFGVMSLFLTDFAPVTERVQAAVARMRAIPGFLDRCRDNVRRAPAAWTERALRECDGALAFLGGGVDLLIEDEGVAHPDLRKAAAAAASAFSELRTHLETELLGRPEESVACGEEALLLYLREGHFLDDTPDEMVRYAEAEMARAGAYLREHAPDFGASGPAEALAGLADLYPAPEAYYGRYQEIWESVRATARARRLLTWPAFPVRYVPRPRWVREAAPHLYFLPYRSPAAYHRPDVHRYLVTPVEPDMPEAEQRRILRATNDSVIRLNHVIHHGSIGHHVQNWHAFRAESRVGRVAAVDCASRIAMFCGGTMAEGWACYATGLMAEAGALTPLEMYAERQSRRRMCARAVVDLQLHRGRLSLDGAARYYERAAGMPRSAARSEAVKNSMFPGTAVMYLMGSDGIHRLREDMSARLGGRFTLRGFHDAFLSYGSVPVSLIAADMMRETREIS